MQTVRVMFYLTLARYTDKKPLSSCKIVNERRTTHDDGRTIAKCRLRDSVTEKFNTYTLCSNMGPTQGSWTRGKELFHNLGRGHHGFSFSKINGSRCFSVGYLCSKLLQCTILLSQRCFKPKMVIICIVFLRC